MVERLAELVTLDPAVGGARSENTGPGDGQRALPGDGGRFPVGLHRRAGGVRARSSGVDGAASTFRRWSGEWRLYGRTSYDGRRESDWALDESQLTDQTIIRRMVLKRCIYGVDKNPLTVELAKVSLWLHSFTVGAPLSFLDHHLRCGDSLIGMRVLDGTYELARLSGFNAGSAIAAAEVATKGMQRIEGMSDADVSEVRESAELFNAVEETTADLRAVLDFLCGLRWLTAGMKMRARDSFLNPVVADLVSNPDNAYRLLSRGPEDETASDEFAQIWNDAMVIAQREGFLHWEVAFPGVWRRWQDEHPAGGFDAVIGNPPWDRIKLQEVEWFATRAPELALAPTAAARRVPNPWAARTGGPARGRL